MNLLLIVGNHPRNLVLIKEINKIKFIKKKKIFIFKRNNFNPLPPKNLNAKLSKLWKLHFKKREISEKKYFKISSNFLKKIKNYESINTSKELNSKKISKYIKSKSFDVCLISGIPIIKKRMLRNLPDYTINLHLGLIPRYKGSITGFWPIYELNPSMLGTTYHVIDEEVDTGEILHQNVPRLSKNDGMHDVASKAIIEALKDLKLVLKEVKHRLKLNLKANRDPSLKNVGKLYKAKDWHPKMLNKIYIKYNDQIPKLFLEGKLNSQKPKLKKLK